MTVLHVLDHSVPLFSGYSFRSRSIMLFQQRLGLRPVAVTSPKHGSAKDDIETHDGIAHYRTRAIMGGAGTIPFVREIRLMLRLAGRILHAARREHASVIHAHSPVLNGLPALWVSRRLGLPVVYEARALWEDAAVDHGTYCQRSLRYRLSRALETFVLRAADAGITICEGMRKDLVDRGIPAARLHVVPNGVDTDWFRPMPRDPVIVQRFGLNGGPVLGFVGSFYRYEGLRLLLESAPALVRELPTVRILLVGGGEEEDELRRLAAPLGDSVVMPGNIPHDRIRQIYSVIDVFVCPRRRNRLTDLVTPLKPLEAMSMRRLVLGSNVGGLAELIDPGVTGLLFTADDREALLCEALRAARDRALRERLGQNARTHLIATRGWQRFVERYTDIYVRCSRRQADS